MSKILYPSLALLILLIIVVSCGKEFSFEANKSKGSLKSDITGDCLSSAVNGLYTSDSLLDESNYIDIQINSVIPGYYSIRTDTINGYYFVGEGRIESVGLSTVRLQGSGKPIAAGVDHFKVTYDSSACFVSVTVLGSTTSSAIYTLQNATGDCLEAKIEGVYIKDTPVDSSNFIQLTTNVTRTGAYSIVIPEVNGISFSGSGVFATSGIQNIKLIATGTPVSEGDFNVQVGEGSATCTYSFKVLSASSNHTAVYSLNCSPVALSGTYTAGVKTEANNTAKIYATVTSPGTYTITDYITGTALNSSNNIVVKVNVTSSGPYTISTNTVNGIKFSATGVFSSPGTDQIVTLVGTGTPNASGPASFTLLGGNSSCKFDINITAPQTTAAIFSCKIDGVSTNFTYFAHADLDDGFGGTHLGLKGYAAVANNNEVPHLLLFITNNDNSPVKPGSYNGNGFTSPNGYSIEIDYFEVQPDGSVIIWNTSSTLFTPTPPFTITVTSISNNRTKGTFSGKLTDTVLGSSHTKTITEGVFDLPIE